MKLSAYELDNSVYDEMFLPSGEARSHCRHLRKALERMSGDEATEIQESVTRSFRNEGIVFTVYGKSESEEQIIPVDCLPRIITSEEWRIIEAGLSQRLTALNHFLDDIYNDAKIVSDGVVPKDMIFDCPQFRPQMKGFSPPEKIWVAICGTDIIRTNDGFLVLEDNLRVPSGVSYMLANRKAIKSSLRRLFRTCKVREIEHYGIELTRTLKELAPAGSPNPSIALLTPGVFNSAFYEHVFLAHEIGATLVEGQDLVVRDGFLFMRTTLGLERIDVLYRRLDDDFLDPTEFRRDSVLGVPGILDACKRGNVSIANSPGTGVADDKGVYAYVPDIIRYYLGESAILMNVETRLCRRPLDLEYTLDNLKDLVVKRVGESGGYGMLIGPQSTQAEREDYAKAVRENPAEFVSQPVISLSRAPCIVGRKIEPRHVDLRPFVLSGKQTRIVPGAFCRVALRRGTLVVNSSQGGGGKDLW
ncbi:MAG: circularly permuted type 2 ATP-grasp protein, partial [Albidovulum sp.]|nr:circularly permuted type 2 ATP-grasp protein [Albidovulum sp.]